MSPARLWVGLQADACPPRDCGSAFGPTHKMGDIAGDLASRRGQVTGTQTLAAGALAVIGSAPLAELEGYGSRLKAFTGGHGSYTMALARYEQAPPTVQQALAAEYAKHRKHEED